MVTEIRPMSLIEILATAGRLLRDHLRLLFTLAAVVSVPLGILEAAAAASDPTPSLFAGLLYLVVAGTGLPIVSAAIAVALGNLYLGRPATAEAARRRALPHFMPLTLTSALAYTLTGLGFLLFVVPGIWLMLAWFVAAPVIIFEGLSGMAALRRSNELMRGFKGRAAIAGVLVVVAPAALAIGVDRALQNWPLLNAAAGIAIDSLVLALTVAVGFVLYLDVRCRHDGFDGEQLAAALAISPPR